MKDTSIRSTNNRSVSIAHVGKFEILRATKNNENVFSKLITLKPQWEFSRIERGPLGAQDVAEIKKFGFGKSTIGNRYFVWGRWLFVWNSLEYPIIRSPEEFKFLAGLSPEREIEHAFSYGEKQSENPQIFSESGKEIF
jgi:hypothetical protein